MKKLASSKFARYLLVGGSAFLIEYSSFFILYQLLSFQIYISNSISFCLGLLISFLFNRGWAFKTGQKYKLHVRHQLLAYGSLALFNLVMTNVLIGLLKSGGIDPRIGKIIIMLVIVGWNFLIFRTLIFAEHSDARVN
jgi:putative flippase GtrA